jgi:hypothetical protein
MQLQTIHRWQPAKPSPKTKRAKKFAHVCKSNYCLQYEKSRKLREAMKLPYKVLDLNEKLRDRWKAHFAVGHDRRRDIEEGIWRRTQNEDNAAQSGWTLNNNSRRRLVHYRYRYNCSQDYLQLEEFYLLHCITAPTVEIDEHEQTFYASLAKGGWLKDGSIWYRGDLLCSFERWSRHPKDIEAKRTLEAGYESFEAVVRSRNCDLPVEIRNLPWDVLAGGPRVKDTRGDPTIVNDLASLSGLLPFQVEVGCGTSFEAGVPPLHRLHEVYRVTNRNDNRVGNYAFTLAPKDDPLLIEILGDTQSKFPEFVEMFRACFLAEPTPGLLALAAMSKRGHLVGPVITNNFDVLAARAGLQECFVRRYDQRIPDVPFLPDAKSLLVVGNHADRRAVQARARERGLRIFFLDPEGFWLNGAFEPYPLESARTGDLLCRKTASEGLVELAKILN